MRLGIFQLRYRWLAVSIHAPGRGATSSKSGHSSKPYPFQFTHPGGVRQARADIIRQVEGFNSRTREGCDHFTSDGRAIKARFNSRTREGCDDGTAFYGYSDAMFQFTHPGGVRPIAAIVALGVYFWFQFTHPGGVRQSAEAEKSKGKGVSIHAPGRGATPTQVRSLLHQQVSIHAPGRGATTSSRARQWQTSSFNSRTREGCDNVTEGMEWMPQTFQFTHPGGVRLLYPRHPKRLLAVSIHAPGRGATWAVRTSPPTLVGFNSRTREGCDGSPLQSAPIL